MKWYNKLYEVFCRIHVDRTQAPSPANINFSQGSKIMTVSEIISSIEAGALDQAIVNELAIAENKVSAYKTRLISACREYEKLYGGGEAMLFSVGGRSEISGNHTDHNRGKVIAASVGLDIIAVAARSDSADIRIKSEGFPEDTVALADISSPDQFDNFTSGAIIAGMCNAFAENGGTFGSFNAYTTSNVLKGSGLSSSAAFEVMVGNIINHLYNNARTSAVDIAKYAQYAENVYFGKPCGLMDQTACAVGGFIAIDFNDPSAPIIEKINFDLAKAGYALVITDTGGNHADLNEDYASVPAEMKSVAAYFGRDALRGITRADIVANMTALREKCGDRAVLRALHFIAENERAGSIADMLKNGDLKGFLAGIRESGNSSYKYLQNVYTVKNVKEQGLSLALCLSEDHLNGVGGVCRVHGGGFAGTVQAFVPLNALEEYTSMMKSVFGDGSVYVLSVRNSGAIRLL